MCSLVDHLLAVLQGVLRPHVATGPYQQPGVGGAQPQVSQERRNGPLDGHLELLHDGLERPVAAVQPN